MKNLLCLSSFLLFAITTYAQDCNMNENAQSYYSKANIAAQEAKSEADYLYAIGELRKALQFAPNCPDIYFNMGLLYEKSSGSGNIEKDIDCLKQAIKNFKKYLELQPDAQDKQEVKYKINELEVKYDIISGPIIKKNKKPVSIGFFCGLNYPNYSYSSKQTFEIDNTPDAFGFQLGFFLDIRLSNVIYIQPGVSFSGRPSGMIYETEEWDDMEESDKNIMIISNSEDLNYYLDFPIYLILKGKVSKSTWYAGVGPEISYIDYTDYYLDYKKTSMSINFKAGYSIHAFFMEFGYKAGMTNLLFGQDLSIKNNYFFGSIGLKF